MKLTLSEKAKTPVRPLDFWIAVAAVVALVCAMGMYQFQTGRPPAMASWFLGGLLLLLLVFVLLQLLRYGRRAFPRHGVMILIGYTLLAVGQLWPHSPGIIQWAANAGVVVLVTGTLAPYLEFGRPKNEQSGAIPPGSAA